MLPKRMPILVTNREVLDNVAHKHFCKGAVRWVTRCFDSRRTDHGAGAVLLRDLSALPQSDALGSDPGHYPVPAAQHA
ncbi:hypothetical protein D3C81_1279670 [compost metagenome]